MWKAISLVFIVAIVVLAQPPSPMPAAADTPFQVYYAANLNQGESYINLVNDGATGAPPLGPGLGAAVGNVCANVYAFDQNEEMISCCSCLLTPNQARSLGVNRDITSNTATQVTPNLVTVKVVATRAGSDGAGTSCSNAAATVTGDALVTGLIAFGTTLHMQGSGYTVTETPFAPARLSDGEISSLANTCGRIIGNLSNFGTCGSCRSVLDGGH